MSDAMSDYRPDSVSLRQFEPLPGDQYPLEFMQENGVVKLRDSDSELVVGVSSPDSDELQQRLRLFHRRSDIRFVTVDATELASYIGRRAAGGDEPDTGNDKPDDDRNNLNRLANDAPIINLVNSIFLEGIRRGASDIHIESYPDTVRVRLRIDGVLQSERGISRAMFAGVSSRIKIMANLNIMERRLPQDGRISVEMLGEQVDVRISIVPTISGESIVLRLFNRSHDLLGLVDLGFDETQLTEVRQMAAHHHGLIAVTGPTGSGKTTTLNALLRELRSDAVKIITIEDPVEYHIPGIEQIQVNERIGLTFDSVLRRILRQDPNIIMVGEIRDQATAELALRAALTGHLVLTTLHTNDAPGAVVRLANMGLEPYLIAGVLRGVMAQRLVRRLCIHCREPVEPHPAELALFSRKNIALPKGAMLYRAVGCDRCMQTGFRGRVALLEKFSVDSEVENWILDGLTSEQLSRNLRERGMTGLLESGLQQVVIGTTTLQEVEKVVAI